MLEVASDAKIICGICKASIGYLHFNNIIPCRDCNIDESERIAVITNTTTLAVDDTVTKSMFYCPDCYKAIKKSETAYGVY